MCSAFLEDLSVYSTALHQHLCSATCRTAIRAFLVLLLTAVIATNITAWTQLVFYVSPFLAFDVLILAVVLLATMWRRHHGDVTITLFKCLLYTLRCLRKFREECLTVQESHEARNPSSEVVMRRQRNRKLLRIAVMFLMIQHCIAPDNHTVWVHSLLAYLFLVDVHGFLWQQYELWTSASDAGGHSNVTQRPELSQTLLFTINGSKAMLICLVLCYQFTSLGCLYVVLTAVYFFTAQRYLEKQLTMRLETQQLDIFEGLEQYYVQGTYATIELLMAFVFMLWSLIKHKQFLMLAALYTNIYTGGREVVNLVVTVAVSEWTTLAQFRRATRQELRALDDVCAVCLSAMRSARRTPCRHYFHGHCLRRCLKEKTVCPICAFVLC